VVVPLGTRRVTGVILEVTEALPPGRIREVADVLSEALPAELLELALWAARYYRAPRGSLLQAVLPPAVRRSQRRQVVPVDSISRADDKLGSARSPLDTERTLPNMREGDLLVGAFTHGQVGYHRPFPGAGHYRGPVEGLYLCGSSSHPGGNVTGLPGYNSAQVVLADLGLHAPWAPEPLEARLESL